uniref:DNA-directed RNA polymerase II subunit GRINL1A n=1 Tax=Clastoptera arizonana TaxID=38151 RepID=A0A1B6DJV0_9HEMI
MDSVIKSCGIGSSLDPVIKKIPGIPCQPKSEKQGYIGDLSLKTKLELLDLLDRQEKLLNNRKFINKLPDKGARITHFKNEIEIELKKKNESEILSEMLSKLNLNGKEGLDSLEWTGNCAPGYKTHNENNVVDELSEDEIDPLKILASHSGAGFHKKKLRIEKAEEPLIKSSDLIEDDRSTITSPSDRNSLLVEDKYAKDLRSKIDTHSKPIKEKFLPFKTLNPPKNKEVTSKKKSIHWEVTAATPPLPVHGDVQLVSLQESIKLQFDQQKKLKEVQLKHAIERLASSSIVRTEGMPQTLTEYRIQDTDSSSSDEEEINEVGDEDEENEKGRVVVYNIIDA